MLFLFHLFCFQFPLCTSFVFSCVLASSATVFGPGKRGFPRGFVCRAATLSNDFQILFDEFWEPVRTHVILCDLLNRLGSRRRRPRVVFLFCRFLLILLLLLCWF